MKLQRNNKYAKMISSILLTSTILTGCSSAEAVVQPKETEIIEEAETPMVAKDTEVHDIAKDENYYLNYYKISDQERINRLSRLDIKYPDLVHRSQNIKTLIVKDNDVYKILPVIELWDTNNKISYFYDLFTEEELFEYPYKDISEVTATCDPYYGNYTGGYDFSKIKNAIPYFDDKEIVEFGVCFYAQTFFEKNLNKFAQRDDINYYLDIDGILEYYYDLPFNSDTLMINTYEYADNYVTTVPLENQVTSKELGLKSTHRIEDKYSDYWKLTDEQINERLSDFEFDDKNSEISADIIQTLVFKDEEDNYKVMNIRMSVNDNNELEIYDVYTNMHLFDSKIKDNFGYSIGEEKYVNIDFKHITNAIPYFENKEILDIYDFLECAYFVENNSNYFAEKDGINYKPLENSYYYYIYPKNGEGDFSLEDIVKTKEEFAKYYIISLPDDLRVNSKDLKMGLDKDKVKVLN